VWWLWLLLVPAGAGVLFALAISRNQALPASARIGGVAGAGCAFLGVLLIALDATV
jgi:hypothetical protein